jgi:hypothetical protein
MGNSYSFNPPAPPALPVPSVVANVQPSLFTSKAYNNAGVSMYDNYNSSSGILVDTDKLNSCMKKAANDPYAMNNCILTYSKGINDKNQIINLTKGETPDAFNNVNQNTKCGNGPFDVIIRNSILIVFALFILLLLCKK